MIYAIPVQMVFFNIVYIFTIAKFRDNELLGIEEWGFDKHRIIIIETVSGEQGFVASVILFSPTLITTICIYTPLWVVTKVVLAFIRYEMDNAAA